MADHEILTVEELAEYLRVSERTVYDWAKRGEIPCGRFGSTWRFKRSAVEQWVDRRLTSGGELGRPEEDAPVQISDLLTRDRVVLLPGHHKHQALLTLVGVLARSEAVASRDALAADIFRREYLLSTGIGLGIAVPHVRLASVSEVVMAVGIQPEGIVDYASLDDEPVKIICMIAAPQNQHGRYVRALASVTGRLRSANARRQALEAASVEEAYEVLTR